MRSTDNGFARARRQIADDGRFDVYFSLHDFYLGSDKRGPLLSKYQQRGNQDTVMEVFPQTSYVRSMKPYIARIVMSTN